MGLNLEEIVFVFQIKPGNLHFDILVLLVFPISPCGSSSKCMYGGTMNRRFFFFTFKPCLVFLVGFSKTSSLSVSRSSYSVLLE